MRKAITAIAFILLIGLLHKNAKASHIIGGVITYECLGGNDYEFTMKVFRDCYYANPGATFDDPAYVAIYDDSDNLVQSLSVYDPKIDTLEVQAVDSCMQLPPDICVERGIYTFTATLSPGNSYYVTYQRCCRNQTISNIYEPDTTGATYLVDVIDPGVVGCNTSPQFSQYPPIAICKDEPLVYDHSATDPEGDSLVYSFCSPLHGASSSSPVVSPPAPKPYAIVNWKPGYSASSPLNGNPGFSIDPQTGVLTGTPVTTGQFVVGVCVREYDRNNGTLKSIVRRDFQFNVVQCQKTVVAALQSPITECGSKKVKFDNGSTGANKYYWNFGDPTTTNDKSNAKNPTYTYPDTGTYRVQLVAEASGGCADTSYATVNILPGVHADYKFQNTCKQDPIQFNNQSYADSSTIIDYQWFFDDGDTSKQSDPSHQFSSPATYNVKLIALDGNGCTDTMVKPVKFYPRVDVKADLPERKGCAPMKVHFKETSMATSEYDFKWSFGDGTTSSEQHPVHIYKTAGSYQVGLAITSPSGCYSSDTFTDGLIQVRESPSAAFSMDPKSTSYLEPEVNFYDNSTDAVKWLWDFDGEDTSHQPNPTYAFQDTGYRPVEQVVFHQNGCTDTTVNEVFIKPDFLIWFPNAFTPDNDGSNDTFGAVGKFKGVSEFKLQVWTRWGEMLYQTDRVFDRWNGRKHNTGEMVQSGVYVYTATLIDYFGQKYTYDGVVTLLR